MKQHYFPKKSQTKKKKNLTRIVVLLLLEEIILASVFIIQTCLCTGQIPEMFHADYVYKHFFSFFFFWRRERVVLDWVGLGFLCAFLFLVIFIFLIFILIAPWIFCSLFCYENIPEVTSHCQKLACLYFWKYYCWVLYTAEYKCIHPFVQTFYHSHSFIQSLDNPIMYLLVLNLTFSSCKNNSVYFFCRMRLVTVCYP